MKGLITIASLVFFSLISCTKDKSKSNNSADRTSGLTPLSADVISQLNKNCTSIDIIPLRKDANASLSFSKNESQALQYMVSFIGDEKGILGNCNPEAHIVFGENGEINYEADLYYNNGCNAFAWIKGGKITHINSIKPEGVEFFKNFIRPISREKMDSLSKM